MYIYHILITTLITTLIITVIIYNWLLHLTKRHKNFKKRNLCLGYHLNCILNIFIAAILYILIIVNLQSLWDNVRFPNVITIFAYLVIVDSCLYWVHRVIHKIPFLKKQLHTPHHTAHDLVPLDLYFTDVKEHILYISLVAMAPLLFLNMNIVDYLLVNVIAFWHSLYTHSESNEKFLLPLFIDSKYHKHHHQIGKGNYAVYFNMWDNYMGSRIKTKKRNPKTPKNPKKTHSLKTATI